MRDNFRRSLIGVNDKRNKDYQSDLELDHFLFDFNERIQRFQITKSRENNEGNQPVFIYGLPRSGSSLLYELLATCSSLGYINNFISRFWGNPQIGVKLFKSFNLNDIEGQFDSDFGKFRHSIMSPHEFMFFWDKLFAQYAKSSQIQEEMLNFSDKNRIKGEILSIVQEFNKNVLFKSQFWITYQVPFLRTLFPDAKFILIERDPIYVAQSIYFARKKINVNVDDWWSIMPPGYEEVLNEGAMEQIAFQVKEVNNFIHNMTCGHSDLVLQYSDLCNNPRECLQKVEDHLTDLGVQFDIEKCPTAFEVSKTFSLPSMFYRYWSESLNL